MKKTNTWSRDEIKEIPVGTLVRFVHATPRYIGETPQDPGGDLLGTVGVVLSDGVPCGHSWGGLFSIHSNEHDGHVSHYGDFLEIVG